MVRNISFLSFVILACIFSNTLDAQHPKSSEMKIAALFDIHANPMALRAVLAEVEKYEVDLIIVGGDVISGPMVKETLALLQDVTIPIKYILGNAESELLRHVNGKEINGLSERADTVTRWSAKQLSAEQISYIGSWSPTQKLNLGKLGKVLFCHGTPRSDVEIFTKITPTQKLLPIFENIDASIVVCGHTHIQFDRKIGNVRVVNAGSVGMPFGKTGADWLLMDEAIRFMHTEYDLEAAAERIRNSNYPYAESFTKNNLLSTPSEEDALKMLSNMEQKQEN